MHPRRLPRRVRRRRVGVTRPLARLRSWFAPEPEENEKNQWIGTLHGNEDLSGRVSELVEPGLGFGVLGKRGYRRFDAFATRVPVQFLSDRGVHVFEQL